MIEILKNVKEASRSLYNAGSIKRNNVLRTIAQLLDKKREEIKNANKIDVDNAIEIELPKAMISRLTLLDKEIDSMIKAVLEIAQQEEVIGSVISGSVRPNGLKIQQIRVPLGVVAMVYESRPNVTIDSACLCIKSGNAVILRGGKEAINSNKILSNIIAEALDSNNLPRDIVYFVEDIDRSKIADIASAKGLVDVIIPRGGSALINYVLDNAKIPVIMHDKGVCHTYIDKTAKKEMAMQIVFNAKAQKPSACNALETLLIHKDIASDFLPDISQMLKDVDVDLRCDEIAFQYMDARPAITEDWESEYNDMILAIKVVENIDEAIAHITKYGSGHSEAIITESYSSAQQFLDQVDAAAVYVNASTRFTDGGEFGLGAEMGISTQKLHVRGPMGAKDLTTTKYLIYGNGQLRT